MRVQIVLVHGPGAGGRGAVEGAPGFQVGAAEFGAARAGVAAGADDGGTASALECRCSTPVVHLVADLPDEHPPLPAAAAEQEGGRSAPTGPGAVLAALLRKECGRDDGAVAGVPLERIRVLPPTGTLVVRVGVGAPPPGPESVHAMRPGPRDLAAGLVLGVVGGAGAGTLLALHRGRHTIGRSGADLVIDDPSVSRCHAVLDVLPDRVLLTDAGSTNGLTVDGHPRAQAVITVDSRIVVGSVPLRLLATDRPLPAHPTVTALPAVAAPPVVPPAPGGRGASPSLLVLSAVLPLLIGIVLAITTGSWLLLGLSAMSVPVSVVPAWTTFRAARDARRHGSAANDGAGGRQARRGGRPTEAAHDEGTAVPDLALQALAARRHAGGGPGLCAAFDGDRGARDGPQIRADGDHEYPPGAPDFLGRETSPGPTAGPAVALGPGPSPTVAALLRLGLAPTAADPVGRRGGRGHGRRSAHRAARRALRLPGSRATPLPPARAVLLDLAACRRTEVTGPAGQVAGLLRSVLTQLAGLDPVPRVHLCADPEITVHARLLPFVTVLSPALQEVSRRRDGGASASEDRGSIDTGAGAVLDPDVLIVDLDRLDPWGRIALERLLRDPPPALWLLRASASAADGAAPPPGRAVVRLGVTTTTRSNPTGSTGSTPGPSSPGQSRHGVLRQGVPKLDVSLRGSPQPAGETLSSSTRSSSAPASSTRSSKRHRGPLRAWSSRVSESLSDRTSEPLSARHVLRRIAGSRSVTVHAGTVPYPAGPTGSSGTAWLVTAQEHRPFLPDLMPSAAFERLCLWRASSSHPAAVARSPTALPARCSADAVARSAQRQIAVARLPCVLGVTADGPLVIDLAADGPHVLIAGTTGAGKSELLRTLISSLTRERTPDQLGLVLIDFKGGTALAPLAALPHCDALITDLDGGLERALASVRAELRRREALLRRWNADSVDDPAIPVDAAPGRVVIVIDEFRVMVDDHPEGLAQLVRLAAQGRSLGLHLVMATQRPRGAINGDIRANTAIRIALRTQSADESFDVLGSPVAAALPARLPGRGWISVGDHDPVLFQTASTAAQDRSPGPRIADWTGEVIPADAWLGLPGSPEQAVALPNPTGARRRRVIAPPLPSALTGSDVVLLADPCTAPGPGPLAAVDRPDDQRLQPWFHLPGIDPHLAVLGEDRPAVDDVVRRVLAATATGVRCYLLDATGALDGVLPADGIGARVATCEPQRAVRVLERLARTLDARTSARFTAARRDTGEEREASTTPLLLVVHDWAAWSAVFRAQPWSGGEELVLRLAAASSTAGLGLVVSGGRDLLGSRLLAGLARRVYVPGSTDPLAVAEWPRLPRVEPVPGRVVVEAPDVGPAPARAQLIVPPRPEAITAPPDRGGPTRDGPVMRPLPTRVSLAHLARWRKPEQEHGPAVASTGRSAGWSLLVGVGGDGDESQRLPATPGRVLPVVGAPGSGRSTLLRALVALNEDTLWTGSWPGVGTDRSLQESPPSVLLLDDADTADPVTVQRLTAFLAAGHAAIVAVATSTALAHRLPLISVALMERRFVVVGMDDPATLLPLGLRLPVDPTTVPGRAVWVDGAGRHPFQVADAPADPFSRPSERGW
ncbi:FtsK/SpoIIIE domain-containing protein [Tersicoccus sp. MR15.9]|uniref:FtsK/SpoIIIE domain-containing protein n=1 Tax=Tersicoccus mangrovi TaxID=3121635 RepID=UPI002FE641EC